MCPSSSTRTTTLTSDSARTERSLTHRSTHRGSTDEVSTDSTTSTVASRTSSSPVHAQPSDIVLPLVTGPHNRRRGSQCKPIVPPIEIPRERRSTAPAAVCLY